MSTTPTGPGIEKGPMKLLTQSASTPFSKLLPPRAPLTENPRPAPMGGKSLSSKYGGILKSYPNFKKLSVLGSSYAGAPNFPQFLGNLALTGDTNEATGTPRARTALAKTPFLLFCHPRDEKVQGIPNPSPPRGVGGNKAGAPPEIPHHLHARLPATGVPPNPTPRVAKEGAQDPPPKPRKSGNSGWAGAPPPAPKSPPGGGLKGHPRAQRDPLIPRAAPPPRGKPPLFGPP
eukprot:FR743187.1.p1 GENE.FR743187.1~~FR743187.1.p1  ORF type:complete len:232 (+),score=62.26 FR743187.1:215-910(+)